MKTVKEINIAYNAMYENTKKLKIYNKNNKHEKIKIKLNNGDDISELFTEDERSLLLDICGYDVQVDILHAELDLDDVILDYINDIDYAKLAKDGRKLLSKIKKGISVNELSETEFDTFFDCLEIDWKEDFEKISVIDINMLNMRMLNKTQVKTQRKSKFQQDDNLLNNRINDYFIYNFNDFIQEDSDVIESIIGKSIKQAAAELYDWIDGNVGDTQDYHHYFSGDELEFAINKWDYSSKYNKTYIISGLINSLKSNLIKYYELKLVKNKLTPI